jgi:hypothetical protein
MFNFEGEVSKILFGTLGDDDANFYNELVRQVEESSDSLTNLLNQQFVTVKSTTEAINETISDVEYNEAKVREGLIQVESCVEPVAYDGKRYRYFVDQNYCRKTHIPGE